MKGIRIAALALASAVVLVCAAATGAANQAPGATPGAVRAAAVKRVCTSSLSKWANCGAQVVANANGVAACRLDASRRRARPRGAPQRVQPADDGPDRRHDRDRRRLRPPVDRSGPRRLQRAVRPAAVYDRERLLPQGEPGRRYLAAGDELGLGARDRAGRRDRTRGLPELQDPARRGELGSHERPRQGRERGDRARGERDLQLLGRARVPGRDDRRGQLLPPSRRCDHGFHR